MRKVGITGGIGSGKSTLCALLAERGVAIYDCDAAAKHLMNDEPLRGAIIARFGVESYTDEGLNRAFLAQQIFGNPEAMAAMNSLVHPAVIADFERWADEQEGDYVVVESAILFEAGFADHLDAIVAVLAPERLRLERAMRRDGANEEAIRSRMAAQLSDDELSSRADIVVVNILEDELASSAEDLDRRLKYWATNA